MTEHRHNTVDVMDYFNGTIAKDFAALMLGRHLGYGIARQVYEFALDPTLVVKVETSHTSFQNVAEWDVWDRVKNVKRVKDWFAPCVHISQCGTVMIQKRVAPLVTLPAKVPCFFTDTKRENFGLLDGKPVCCDYGRNLLMEKGMSMRMVKAWWGE